jgi:phage terminase large subunit GpA-like protein
MPPATALRLTAPLEALVRPRDLIAASAKALRMPKRMRLSEWADEKFYLSAESAAEPGRWRTIPYQRGIMDAITDPAVERVSVMKSARIGWTKILDAAIGFYMEQDPCPILAVQPTVEDAEGYSKEEIEPMLRDCPALREVVRPPKKKKAGRTNARNTILHKSYPGGVLSMVGANSPRGFRRTSRKVIALDEVDGYPASAGKEGDPISLAIKRSEYYWDRKILAGSTPTIAGLSRIEAEFRAGDQRRYYVPCPHCGHEDFLRFSETVEGEEPRGHYMQWPEGKPEEAYFVCRANGCVIEHRQKRWMVERGEWRAERPFRGHASFHIWAAYSYSPNATWGHIAAEFLAGKEGGVETLKTVTMTLLGETWKEKGEAPDWLRLYDRREQYQPGTVPAGVLFLTAGMDVQKDRLVWEVVGWGRDRQSWSIDAGVIPGDTSKDETWLAADELLARQWPGEGGKLFQVRYLGVDSGYETQTVYDWARRHVGRVLACKGVSGAKQLLGAPTKVDVRRSGKRIPRGAKVWPVGVDMAKAEFYGWLGLDRPTEESGAPFPPGYCHFPEYGEEHFKQLTSEQRILSRNRNGFARLEWALIPGRENHALDARIYARAATVPCHLDQIAAANATARARGAAGAPSAAPAPTSPVAPGAPAAPRPAGPARSSWLTGGRGATVGSGSSWLSRRR